MGRTKQTARKSSGGKAPRALLTSQTRSDYTSWVTSQQRSAVYDEHGREQKASFITADSVFYQFTFDRPASAVGEDIPFDVVASTAVTADTTGDSQIPANPEAWVALQLKSQFDGAAIVRPDLDLVLALDISGSMGMHFASETSAAGKGKSTGAPPTRLAVSKRCLLSIAEQLGPHDRLSVVTFNHSTTVLLPMEPWQGKKSMERLTQAVNALKAHGGTDLQGALNSSGKMLRGGVDGFGPIASHGAQTRASSKGKGAAADVVAGPSPNGRSSRVFFLTDMRSSSQDNTQLLAHVAKFASKRIYTTVVGIGVDLASKVVGQITATRGCRYASVNDPEEFETLTADEFAHDCTPIAFDIELAVNGGWALDKGYGSSEIEAPTNGVAKMACEFPTAAAQDGSTAARGSVLLFKLRPLALVEDIASASAGASAGAGAGGAAGKRKRVVPSKKGAAGMEHAGLTLTYKTTTDTTVTVEKTLAIPTAARAGVGASENYFEGNVIRKAVALAKFVEAHNGYVLADEPVESTAEMHTALAKEFQDHHSRLLHEMEAVGDATVLPGGFNAMYPDLLKKIADLETSTAAERKATAEQAAAREATAAKIKAAGAGAGGSGASANVVLEEAACGVCLEVMNGDNKREPMSMPCGHSLCGVCLAAIPQVQLLHRDGTKLCECPYCRQKFERSKATKNHALTAVINALQAMKNNADAANESTTGKRKAATAATAGSATPTDEATPAKKKAAPTKKPATPAKKPAAPAKKKAAPTKKKAAPTKKERALLPAMG